MGDPFVVYYIIIIAFIFATTQVLFTNNYAKNHKWGKIINENGLYTPAGGGYAVSLGFLYLELPILIATLIKGMTESTDYLFFFLLSSMLVVRMLMILASIRPVKESIVTGCMDWRFQEQLKKLLTEAKEKGVSYLVIHYIGCGGLSLLTTTGFLPLLIPLGWINIFVDLPIFVSWVAMLPIFFWFAKHKHNKLATILFDLYSLIELPGVYLIARALGKKLIRQNHTDHK